MEENYIHIILEGELTDVENATFLNVGGAVAFSNMISGSEVIDILIIGSPLVVKYVKDIIISKINAKMIKKFKYKDIELTGMNAKEIINIIESLSIDNNLDEK